MNPVKESVAVQNPLVELHNYGQSIWLDYIRRSLITSGGLKRLVDEDGLRGVTSNPTIFDKAIAGGSDYDAALRSLLRANPTATPMTLFDAIEIEDIQAATDILRPVYDRTDGADGFVSIEVSPAIARETKTTMEEARRLWKAVNRPNLMVKVPATSEGIPAIYTLIAEGININITLMFSMKHYEDVANAYISGLERAANPRRIASVASFFVSRVDTMIDKKLEEIGTPAALALRGKIAIANSKMVYQRFRELFSGERWEKLTKRGARVQRPLWASTGTKNPAYSDVLYVETLIGADTVNTLPPATMDAFRDHGHARETVTEGLDEAREQLAQLAKVGIDLDKVGDKLQDEGVDLFVDSLDKLLATLEQKRCTIVAEQVDRQTLHLGTAQKSVDERLATWEQGVFLRRLWAKDYTLWSKEPQPEITDRLGWLTLPETMLDQVGKINLGEKVRAEGIQHVVLLGMGGSSLAPEVFQRIFGKRDGFPELIVLDSTHPDSVRAVEKKIDLKRTWFLVSSKSGTTTEMLSFFYYFHDKLAKSGETKPGSHFIAITDPGTPLEKLAGDRGFRGTFSAPSDVGGRYSALTVFGLVPAGLIGVDIKKVLERAATVAETCAFCVPEKSSAALALGAAMGELAQSGRDKITFFASPGLNPFSVWVEQLIAESTGKQGKGIVPIADENIGAPESYGKDRFFVYLSLDGDRDEGSDAKLAKLEAAGHPVARIQLRERADAGQEFFRWEIATAAAGAVLGINPFNQPDVQLAKELSRKAMDAVGKSKSAAEPSNVVSAEAKDFRDAVKKFLASVKPGDYVGLQAYLQPSTATENALQRARLAIRDKLKVATTLGFGPRFLHSTGQLHKGGANNGAFVQFLDEPASDLAVPETNYTFGQLIRAQAEGDYQAMQQRGRRVLRVYLGKDVAAGLSRFFEAVNG